MQTSDIYLNPRSIAVIGASHDTTKIGYKVVQNIVQGGYRGKIYPVNPQGGEVLGLRAYRSVEEIGSEVDVASIVIPARFVFDAVKSCARKRVKYLTIISSGFSEIGNNEEEKRIVTFARQNGMRVLGPNIFGIYSAEASLNATFGSSRVIPGGVAIITQSGALGIAMIGKTAVENIGLSAIVSVGNKTDVDEADLLEYLIQNPRTKIILMYIEGVREGERLIQTLKRVTEKIPVVVIKSGRSERGAIAAASHTGSLAGSDEIFDAIIRQCGVIRAESVEEAFNWCKFLSNQPAAAGGKHGDHHERGRDRGHGHGRLRKIRGKALRRHQCPEGSLRLGHAGLRLDEKSRGSDRPGGSGPIRFGFERGAQK